MRRKPVVASLGAAAILLLLAVAIGSPVPRCGSITRGPGGAKQLRRGHEPWPSKRKRKTEERCACSGSIGPKARDRDLRGWEWGYLWRESKSDELFALPGTKHEMTSVAFSPDGRYLATGEGRGRVTIWDLSVTQAVTHADGKFAATCLQFSKDGKLLAAGSSWANGGLRLWDWNPPNLTSHTSSLTNGRVGGVRLDEQTITAVTPQFLRQWDRPLGRELPVSRWCAKRARRDGSPGPSFLRMGALWRRVPTVS